MHTFRDPLRRAITTHHDAEALVCGDVRNDFGTTVDRCRRLAAGLQAIELPGGPLRRGDRVAIVAANCHRYIETYLAVPAAGLVLVPLNSRHTDHELRYAAEDSATRVLITDRPPSPLDDTFERVIRVPDEYEALLEAVGPSDDPFPIDVFPDDLAETDLAGLFYTGGTTGAAKGVMLTHRNLIANAWSTFTWSDLTPDDRYLVVSPLFHAAGTVQVLASVWKGSKQVVMPAFDPAAVLDVIERERISITLLVPTMLAATTDEQLRNPRDVSSLRQLSHGASPATLASLRRAATTFPDAELVHLYGATETSPVVTALRNEQRLLETPIAKSCGAPVIGVDVAILDDDGTRLPTGGVGEVAVRGANVMQGYWNKPEATAAALSDGWYRSGDVGRVDDHGHLFLVDRSKDMIVSGGENVYSTEVEDALASHPAVAEVAVIGVPDERWGEAVHAVVVLREPAADPDAVAAELTAHCRETIAGYKVPKHIEISADPLPKSGAGKILKRTLRDPHWAGHDSAIV
jgi:long-chain acyl-CoA synthetase